MIKFTARDLDRRSATVLKTCDEEGAVEISHRDGRRYVLRRERGGRVAEGIPDFQARQRALGMPAIAAETAAKVDRLIAGEELDRVEPEP